jgi:hypothetical protein
MTFDPHDPEATAAFVEGRLLSQEAARVRAHAAECAECREVIAGLVKAGSAEGVVPAAGARTPWFIPGRYLLPVAATLALATLAAVLVVRIDPNGGSTVPPAVSPPGTAAPSSPPVEGELPVARPPAASAPAPAPAPDQDLTRRRSGERTVQGKRFQLTAGEWIDAAFDPLLGLPVVEASAPSERQALLDKVPALRPFARLGPRVTVVHDGTVYRFH